MAWKQFLISLAFLGYCSAMLNNYNNNQKQYEFQIVKSTNSAVTKHFNEFPKTSVTKNLPYNKGYHEYLRHHLRAFIPSSQPRHLTHEQINIEPMRPNSKNPFLPSSAFSSTQFPFGYHHYRQAKAHRQQAPLNPFIPQLPKHEQINIGSLRSNYQTNFLSKNPFLPNKSPGNNNNALKSGCIGLCDFSSKNQPQPQSHSHPSPQPKPHPQPKPKPQLWPHPHSHPKPQSYPKLQPQPQPKPAQHPQPQPKAQPKPQPQPQPKAQPKPHPQPQAKPQPQPQPHPQPQPELKPQVQPKPQIQPQLPPSTTARTPTTRSTTTSTPSSTTARTATTATTSELKPQVQPQPQLQPQSQPHPQPQPELKPKPQQEKQPQAQPQPYPLPQQEKQPQAQPQPQPPPHPQPKPQPQPQPHPQPQPTPQPHPQPQQEQQPQAQPQPYPQPQTEPQPQAQPQPQPPPQPQPKPQPKKQTESNSVINNEAPSHGTVFEPNENRKTPTTNTGLAVVPTVKPTPELKEKAKDQATADLIESIFADIDTNKPSDEVQPNAFGSMYHFPVDDPSF